MNLTRRTTRPHPWGKAPTRERARWPIARLLNRSRRTCWAELVCWVLTPRGARVPTRITGCFTAAPCRLEALDHRDGACYCGKFRRPATTTIAGGMPGQGKSSSARAILAGASLDPSVEIRIWDDPWQVSE